MDVLQYIKATTSKTFRSVLFSVVSFHLAFGSAHIQNKMTDALVRWTDGSELHSCTINRVSPVEPGLVAPIRVNWFIVSVDGESRSKYEVQVERASSQVAVTLSDT